MKDVEISYRLEGQVNIKVPDDFEVNDDNVKSLVSNLSDKELVENVDNAFSTNGIDEDAIIVTNYEVSKG